MSASTRAGQAAALAALLVGAASLSPGKAGDGAKEKKGTFAVVNPAKDIHVLSDREEGTVAFFRRHRLVVGGLLVEELRQALAAEKPRTRVFVNYTSHNDDPKKEELFGTFVKLAPIKGEVARLLQGQVKGPDGKERFSVTVILRRDAADAELYHAVGYTTRSSVSSFARGKRQEPDDFSPQDLRFRDGEAK
jgi:hypothetical protein